MNTNFPRETTMRNVFLIFLMLGLFLCAPAGADEDHGEEGHGHEETAAGHDEEGHGAGEEDHGHEEGAGGENHEHEEGAGGHGEEHGEEGVVKMDAAQREANGVVTALVARRPLSEEVVAPGEVTINVYRSSQITPRINAQIVARHARLGDPVKKGQAVVTLSSVEMAEAQGGLLQADVEWKRVKKLGRKVVSEKRYIAAQVERQQAYARVRAYGMTKSQIDALLKQGDASKATGEFKLLAGQDGVVISDDFIVGEVVQPGRVLFEISDESVLWVEAQLTPAEAGRVVIGAPARVRRDGGQAWLSGRVVQLHHRLDEITRTQSVRIEVDNSNDDLHPGQFVEAAVQTGAGAPVIAVPKSAVVLMKGSPTVFKVEGDELHPQVIEVGASRGGWTEVLSGLPEGEEIVVQGVFFLKSLILKSQMGEGHAH